MRHDGIWSAIIFVLGLICGIIIKLHYNPKHDVGKTILFSPEIDVSYMHGKAYVMCIYEDGRQEFENDLIISSNSTIQLPNRFVRTYKKETQYK